MRLADGDAFGPLQRRSPRPATHPTTWRSSPAGRSSPGTPCSGTAASTSRPTPGALRGYLAALDRMLQLDLDVICPGHGPLVGEPRAKLAEYRDHRLERERRLVAALDDGLRSPDDLLDRVWSDVPSILRPAAAVTLAAHLDKLQEEGRLPEGVDREALPRYGAA